MKDVPKHFSATYIDMDANIMAFYYDDYTYDQALAEYKMDYPDKELKDYEIYVTWFRYLEYDEICDDWEYAIGYDDGSLELYEQCEPDDEGAFKGWVVGGVLQ